MEKLDISRKKQRQNQNRNEQNVLMWRTRRWTLHVPKPEPHMQARALCSAVVFVGACA